MEYFKLGYAKLDRMKQDPGAVRELAVQAGQLGQWKQAIELWNRLLELRPAYGEAMINLAGAYWNLESYGQSLHWAQKAVQHNRKVKEAPFNLAISLLFLGRFEEAQTVLETLLQTCPSYLAAGFMLTVAYACHRKEHQAKQALLKLKNTPVVKALPMALNDVVQRMIRAGHPTAAQNVAAMLKNEFSSAN